MQRKLTYDRVGSMKNADAVLSALLCSQVASFAGVLFEGSPCRVTFFRSRALKAPDSNPFTLSGLTHLSGPCTLAQPPRFFSPSFVVFLLTCVRRRAAVRAAKTCPSVNIATGNGRKKVGLCRCRPFWLHRQNMMPRKVPLAHAKCAEGVV